MMVDATLRVAPLVIAVLLAGCTTGMNASTPPDPAEPGAAAPVRAPRLECPAGATTEPAPGACAGTFGGALGPLGEPDVALHPTQDGVVAVGVNSILQAPPDQLVALPSQATQGARLFVTEDGGATWARRPLPEVTGVGSIGDPSLAFDDQGRLHWSSLASTPGPGSGVLHGRSDDLGRTWTEAAYLAGPDALDSADRNWLSVDGENVFLTWQFPAGNRQDTFTEVAWSGDGGATWRVLGEGARPEACNLQTPVRVGPAGPVFACLGLGGIAVFALDPEAGAVAQLATLEGATGTLRLAAGNGTLWLGVPSQADFLVQASVDGGMAWGPAVAFLDGLAGTAGWSWSWPTVMGLDGQGHLHALVAGGPGEDCYRGGCDPPDYNVLHVARAADGTLLSETTLTPPGQPVVVDTTRSPGNEFHGLAFAGDRGWASWAFGGTVHYTRVVS